MNNDNRNLKDLLKASGYNDVDNEAATFAPHLAEVKFTNWLYKIKNIKSFI